MGVAVIFLLCALVHVSALNSVAFITSATLASESAIGVFTVGVDIAVGHAVLALVHIWMEFIKED